MADYIARIRELTRVRDQVRDECTAALRAIGVRITTDGADDLAEGGAELLDRYAALSHEIDTHSAAIERIDRIENRRASIRDSSRTLRRELDSQGKGMGPTYRAIGEVAFRLFREHPLIDSSYSSAFEQLAKYQDDIRTIDREIERISAAETAGRKNVLGRMGDQGKLLVLKSRRSTREAQLPRILERAGEQLARTDFIAQMGDAELTDVSTPIREVEARSRQIEQDLANLSDEDAALAAELAELCGEQKPAKARETRESAVRAATTSRSEVLARLGEENLPYAADHFPEEEQRYRACAERNAHFDHLLERLEAGKRAEMINRDLVDLRRRRESLIRERQLLEERIASLDAREKELTAEQETQAALRGTETELFDG